MKKFLPILILFALAFPLAAQAGFLDVLLGVLAFITCILFGVLCPDPCTKLLADVGTSAYRLCRLVDRISEALYLIGWSLALVVILWGGIIYMTSGGNEDQTKRAKKIILNGLIGAAIIICSGFILNLLVDFLAPVFGY